MDICHAREHDKEYSPRTDVGPYVCYGSIQCHYRAIIKSIVVDLKI